MDNEAAAKMNQTNSKIMFQAKKERTLLRKAFDDVGITYEIDNQGVVHYRYKT